MFLGQYKVLISLEMSTTMCMITVIVSAKLLKVIRTSVHVKLLLIRCVDLAKTSLGEVFLVSQLTIWGHK